MRFSDLSVGPGVDVSVLVSAHPMSYVGLLAVDQSVLVLKEGNDITRNMASFQ